MIDLEVLENFRCRQPQVNAKISLAICAADHSEPEELDVT